MMFLFLSIDRFFPFSMCTQSNPLVYGFHWKIKKNKYPVLRYDQIQDITKTILGYEWFSSYYVVVWCTVWDKRKYLVTILNSVSSLRVDYVSYFCSSLHHDFIAAAAAAYTYCLGHEKPVILKAKGEIRYK